MSWHKLRKASTGVARATTEAAWRQWAAVLTLAGSDNPARAIVDPEALILASVAFADREPRLLRTASIWCANWPGLLSVQRTKNMLKTWPATVAPAIGELAAEAFLVGGDHRWRALAGEPARRSKRRVEQSSTPDFSTSSSLMFRLRLGLGVGIKADVLAYLLGIGGAGETVQRVAVATLYHGRAVRRALEELAAADFIVTRPTAPVSYSVNPHAWATLLDLDADDPPAWRGWSANYAFTASLEQWVRAPEPPSDSVIASEARDLLERHPQAWAAQSKIAAASHKYPGARFMGPFTEILLEQAEFMAGAA